MNSTRVIIGSNDFTLNIFPTLCNVIFTDQMGCKFLMIMSAIHVTQRHFYFTACISPTSYRHYKLICMELKSQTRSTINNISKIGAICKMIIRSDSYKYISMHSTKLQSVSLHRYFIQDIKVTIKTHDPPIFHFLFFLKFFFMYFGHHRVQVYLSSYYVFIIS